jgi:hypothetical protein
VRVKLVKRPIEYPWTSYRAFIDQKAENSLVDTGETLSNFSKRRDRAIGAYKGLVGTYLSYLRNIGHQLV